MAATATANGLRNSDGNEWRDSNNNGNDDGQPAGDATAITAMVMEDVRAMEGAKAMDGVTTTVAMNGAVAMSMENTTTIQRQRWQLTARWQCDGNDRGLAHKKIS
jgi:hypothetical protein